MIEWLAEVERYKLRITDKYSILRSMLARNPLYRIAASDLVKKSPTGQQVETLTGKLLL